MSFKSFGLSDIGLSRPNNEDVWVALPEIGFFALADGMGGHQAGEVAAKEAIDYLTACVKEIKSSDCIEWSIELRSAIEKTNQWVYQLGKKIDSLKGMGTTICCLLWTLEAVIYAHVGDSRIYRLRNKKLELLTQDHSLLTKWLKLQKERQRTPFRYKNVITRAIGTGKKANPEVAISLHQPGDLYFLCTDGLSDVLTLEDIEQMINETSDIESASKRLIEQAKFKGSSDNITILMVQIEGESAKDLSGQQRDDPARSAGFDRDAAGFERPAGESL